MPTYEKWIRVATIVVLCVAIAFELFFFPPLLGTTNALLLIFGAPVALFAVGLVFAVIAKKCFPSIM
jgi:hypothetical protein